MTLDRLWAGWRADYVGGSGDEAAADGDECVLCGVLAEGSHVVWQGARVSVVLNAYPYTSGHLMVLPQRHEGELELLDRDESADMWATVTDSVRAVKRAFRPHGLNVGANLGRAAGAGVPRHLHLHVVPRWDGDTNFMTTVAETRVLPESLDSVRDRLMAAWPS